MSEDIGMSSCSTSPDDGKAAGGLPATEASSGGGRTSAAPHDSEPSPREATPASFSSGSREFSLKDGATGVTSSGTPGTAPPSGRHSSLSHGTRSSSYAALAHTPPLEAELTSHTPRPDTPLSATVPASYLSHTPPHDRPQPYAMSALHAALPMGTVVPPFPTGPTFGGSSTSLTMMNNPLANPGVSYSRYSGGGAVMSMESVGYDASNEPSLYSAGDNYGYSRIDSKLTDDDFAYMDADDAGSRKGRSSSLNYSGLYGHARVPLASSVMYSCESLDNANECLDNQPDRAIYEDESIFDQPPPPAPSSKPIDKSVGANELSYYKNYYDATSFNQMIASSAKASNREISLNRLVNAYSDGFTPVGLTEMLEDPVEEEEGGERVVWEFRTVTLTRVPRFGFGIAVSGGRDNPHFRNGDPSIAISDVLKAGPAEGKLEVNDRLISANGVNLEGVEYARAVQVLRDSGASVQLLVRRRVVLPHASPLTHSITLTRTKKKEDLGVVLGCRLYVKEIVRGSLAAKNGQLREGDELVKINNSNTDNLSLKEARKLLDSHKEELQLVVRRQATPAAGGAPAAAAKDNLSLKEARKLLDSHKEELQLVVRRQATPAAGGAPAAAAKGTIILYAGGGPSDFQYGSVGEGGGVASPTDNGAASLPPRPPLPRPEDYYTQRPPNSPNTQHGSPTKPQGSVPEPRYVSFRKEGSVGIRLTGGNEVGIFVTAVQPGSQAQLQGIVPGDKVLKVNDMDLTNMTREDAVLYLMSQQDQIELLVQTRLFDYQQILASQKGDLFYIKTHFHYDPEGTGELSFRSGDIFRVVDTLHCGVVGAWQVERIGRNNQETQRGTIPNRARAEELATAQFNAAKKEQTQSESRSGFFKRRRNSRRSKSLGKDHWEDVMFGESVSKFPAYERVSLQHPGFVRPVVLFGPLADVARTKLLADNPDKFSSPQLDSNGEKQQASIIRLSAIREIVERNKHAVLDITPSAVDRLNYAQFYPIVVYLRVESKQAVKEMRAGYPKGRQSSKKLFEQSLKVERLWGHVFTSTLTLTQPDTWPRKLAQAIAQHQAQPVWMAQSKPSEALSDDFLFPMTSRLSYASSPESDLEGGSDPHTPVHASHLSSSPSSPMTQSPSTSGAPTPSHGSNLMTQRSRLVKSSSDPSIAAPEELSSSHHSGPNSGPYSYGAPNMGAAPPPYTASPNRMPAPGDSSLGLPSKTAPSGGDSQYGFGGTAVDDAPHPPHPPPVPRDPDPLTGSSPPPSTSPYGQPPYSSSPPSSLTYGYGPQQTGKPVPNGLPNKSSSPYSGVHHPHFSHHSRLPPPPPANGASNNGGINHAAPAATSTPSTNNNPRFAHNQHPPQPPPPHPPAATSPTSMPGYSPPKTHPVNDSIPANPGHRIPNNNNNHVPNNGSYVPNNHVSSISNYSSGNHVGSNSNPHGNSNPQGSQAPPSIHSPGYDQSDASPPKIDRSNKPGKPRLPPPSGNDFRNFNSEYETNYTNSSRNNREEQHRKMGYGPARGPNIGPNAHDDLKSRYHYSPGTQQFPASHPTQHHSRPRPGEHHTHHPRSSSQPPAYHGEDPYSLKPAPPPKSSMAKPVPPPKPRHQPRGDVPQPWGAREGQTMLGASNGRLSDDYSAIDSGHGSSLERKADTFTKSPYQKQTQGSQGFYLNVPMPGSRGEGPKSTPGMELPNHDHRGSAFELYKKPTDPRARSQQPQQQPHYFPGPDGHPNR
ncbi:tight junction protein ZO-2 [Hyalella azteca]|uniref:Tight junction protein ZO-2 n=1 Tax=Hyalella azteca TaxID=294128 RepID=A0A979FP20_HYAAZ|nr:tight junction protein ZO-2 [Hyalella azteca]